MSAKITSFIALLQAGQYDIDADFQAFILKAVTDSKLTQSTPPPTEAKIVTKKPTSYNIFVSEKMKELKDTPYNERMTQVGALWKALSPEEKSVYATKASETTPYEVSVSPNQLKKGPKTLTNWQLFVSESMPTIKADASIKPKERLGKIGDLWKILSTAEKEAYKAKALIKDGEIKQAKALAIAQA
jgi:galactokinase